MPRMFFDAAGCQGVDTNTRSYDADRSGFITVTDNADIRALKAGGYMIAGGMPKLHKYWVCECGWEASIAHCPKCDRNDLTKVER